ncbi:MAG: hypothetical protein QXU18_15840, partial [Thermoplasmatales archaeon]
DDLSSLYNLYLDLETRHTDDVEDALTTGASMVTITDRMSRDKVREILSITESVILYIREYESKTRYFLESGGSYVFSDVGVVTGAKVQFTSKFRCKNCFMVIPIGEANDGRNKEAPSLP